MPLVRYALVALILVACSREVSDSDLIIAAIDQMESAAEEARSSDFMQYIAADFGGESGSLDRRSLRALILRQLNRHQRIRAQLGPVRVKLDHPQQPLNARVEFEALILGGGDWLPTDGQLYVFETRWRKEAGQWLLVSADWNQAL